MSTLKTLKPGQKGTKELLTRFGQSLLCVRYRYDEARREHVKTVELGRAACAEPEGPVPEDAPDELVRAILEARRAGGA